jgi:thymidylate synthase (FAD)
MAVDTTKNTAFYVWSTPLAEDLIVKMARVSAPHNENNLETAPRLLNYLIKHSHWSPFEMANLCLEIYTTRAISPQILRHRSFTFQEFSQRYACTTHLGRLEMPELRTQDPKNRQSSNSDLEEKLTEPQINDLYYKIVNHLQDADDLYREMLDLGVAKESARFLLPLVSPTRLYMNGTLRSWIHYIQLRTTPGTQLEHRQIALHAKNIFTEKFPTISKALSWCE